MFIYTGFESLLDPEVFIKNYTSAVKDAALEFHFIADIENQSIDEAYRYFTQHYRKLAWSNTKPGKFRVLVPALAIYAASRFRPYDPDALIFPDKVVGLQSAMARRNPNELIALFFGIGIYRLHQACINSPTHLVTKAISVDVARIDKVKLRAAVQTVAETRKKELQAENVQFVRGFFSLMKILKLVVTDD